MQISSPLFKVSRILLVSMLVTGSVTLMGSSKSPYTIHDKAYYADRAVIDFVRPGLAIAINSSQITSAGVISVIYTLTDPAGLALDKAGVTTPGTVTLNYIAATIPKGQEQYVAYTTQQSTGKALGTVTQPSSENDGTTTQTAPGQYHISSRPRRQAVLTRRLRIPSRFMAHAI